MKDFKSTTTRLARLFKKSRDKWKAKALARKKDLLAAEVRIRDLEASRKNWKRKAQEAKALALEAKKAHLEVEKN